MRWSWAPSPLRVKAADDIFHRLAVKCKFRCGILPVHYGSGIIACVLHGNGIQTLNGVHYRTVRGSGLSGKVGILPVYLCKLLHSLCPEPEDCSQRCHRRLVWAMGTLKPYFSQGRIPSHNFRPSRRQQSGNMRHGSVAEEKRFQGVGQCQKAQ